MTENVLIAVIAVCGVIISAICVLGGAIFSHTSVMRELGLIRADLKEFSKVNSEHDKRITKLEPK